MVLVDLIHNAWPVPLCITSCIMVAHTTASEDLVFSFEYVPWCIRAEVAPRDVALRVRGNADRLRRRMHHRVGTHLDGRHYNDVDVSPCSRAQSATSRAPIDNSRLVLCVVRACLTPTCHVVMTLSDSYDIAMPRCRCGLSLWTKGPHAGMVNTAGDVCSQ